MTVARSGAGVLPAMSRKIKRIASLALALVAVAILRLLFATCRVRFSGVDNIRAAEARGGGYLLALWHEHALTGSAGYVNQPVGALVSSSRDGEYLSFLFKRMGVVPIRGSSSRRGRQARVEICTFIRAGLPIAITVDGPRGPAMVCKAGIIDLARKTGAAIVPGAALAGRFYRLGTWDGTLVPLPFSKMVMHHGTPVFVPKETTGPAFEQWQHEVERRIARTCAEAEDQLAHWSAIPKGLPRASVKRGWVKQTLAELTPSQHSEN